MAFFDIAVGDDLEQFIELRYPQALADVGLEQALALGSRQRVGALELDVLDREAAAVGRRRGRYRRGALAGQVLEFFEAPLLFFQQAVLAVAIRSWSPGLKAGPGNGAAVALGGAVTSSKQDKAQHNLIPRVERDIFGPSKRQQG